MKPASLIHEAGFEIQRSLFASLLTQNREG